MKLPCEIIIWYVLPSIRSELVKKLIERGLTQKEVAEKLDVTEATVSQYVNKKRGSRLTFKGETEKALERLADELIQNKKANLTQGICEICAMVKKDKTVCVIHKEYETLPKNCNICFERWESADD